MTDTTTTTTGTTATTPDTTTTTTGTTATTPDTTTATTATPADGTPIATDAELAAQPVAYWTGVAHRQLLAYIRRQLEALGLSQPQYWLLRHLSPADLSPDGQGETVDELTRQMRAFLQAEDDLSSDSDDLVERGLLARDGDGRLWITEPGRLAHAQVKKHIPGLRSHIHAGIDDADYATAVRVLQRMIDNVAEKPDADG
ncbi:MarR family transcriptional regulator [Streptomyces sp. NPDC051907]|uniref:MarR family transcriptional regulator n=1 Tax=Streptomyces sp. NPDC051907 TaxID=3155284 RepID=UPI00343D4D6D